jgi:hypothetical protein
MHHNPQRGRPCPRLTFLAIQHATGCWPACELELSNENNDGPQRDRAYARAAPMFYATAAMIARRDALLSRPTA